MYDGTEDRRPQYDACIDQNGMDVARFNFSHGSYDEHKRRMDMLQAAPRGRGV